MSGRAGRQRGRQFGKAQQMRVAAQDSAIHRTQLPPASGNAYVDRGIDCGFPYPASAYWPGPFALLGYLFMKLRQLKVVGEILAGVVLGPVLLGRLPFIHDALHQDILDVRQKPWTCRARAMRAV